MNKKYKLIFNGELQAGFSREQVESNLLKHTKLPLDKVKALLSAKKPIALLSNQNPDVVEKKVVLFKKLGLCVQVAPMEVSESAPGRTTGVKVEKTKEASNPPPQLIKDQPNPVPSGGRLTIGKALCWGLIAIIGVYVWGYFWPMKINYSWEYAKGIGYSSSDKTKTIVPIKKQTSWLPGRDTLWAIRTEDGFDVYRTYQEASLGMKWPVFSIRSPPPVINGAEINKKYDKKVKELGGLITAMKNHPEEYIEIQVDRYTDLQKIFSTDLKGRTLPGHSESAYELFVSKEQMIADMKEYVRGRAERKVSMGPSMRSFTWFGFSSKTYRVLLKTGSEGQSVIQSLNESGGLFKTLSDNPELFRQAFTKYSGKFEGEKAADFRKAVKNLSGAALRDNSGIMSMRNTFLLTLWDMTGVSN